MLWQYLEGYHAFLRTHLVFYDNYRGCTVLSCSCYASGVFGYLFEVSSGRRFCEPVVGRLYPSLFLIRSYIFELISLSNVSDKEPCSSRL